MRQPLPSIPIDTPTGRHSTPPDKTPSELPPNNPGPDVYRGDDLLPVPHRPPHKGHETGCNPRIEELKHCYERLLREKDARIDELRKEKDSRIEDIKGEKDARIEDIKREKTDRMEELKREKDTRIEEVKRDREAAVKNLEEQLERCRREELRLREENDRLKDENTRLKVELGRAGRT